MARYLLECINKIVFIILVYDKYKNLKTNAIQA